MQENHELLEKANQVHSRLESFYGLPEWREPLPAVDELVSTILSQNTNDRNRDAAFDSLRKRYPTWEEVRDADPQSVIDAVRTAGLANQKGPRIQKVLAQITHEVGTLDLSFLKEMAPMGSITTPRVILMKRLAVERWVRQGTAVAPILLGALHTR